MKLLPVFFSVLFLSLSAGVQAQENSAEDASASEKPEIVSNSAILASESTGPAIVFEIFSVLYSASTGRALVGLVDRFHAARFADCEAPRGGFDASLIPADLHGCEIVPGSAFMLTRENLARLVKAMPGHLRRAFYDGLDPVNAKVRGDERIAFDALTSVVTFGLTAYLLKRVSLKTFSVRTIGRLLAGTFTFLTSLESARATRFAWRESKRVGRFPALEGYLYRVTGSRLVSNKGERFPVTKQTMPQIYQILRRSLLTATERLPGA